MELILTWVIKAEHTGVGGSGGGYLGDPGRAHRYFNKKSNSKWILYFVHRLPAPNVTEQPLFTYYLLQKNFDQKVYLNAHQKTKSTYCVSLKLDNKAKAQHQLVGPA